MGYPITKPINYQKPNIGVIQHCIETVIIEPTTAGVFRSRRLANAINDLKLGLYTRDVIFHTFQ